MKEWAINDEMGKKAIEEKDTEVTKRKREN